MTHYVSVAKSGTADWDRLNALALRMEPRLRAGFLASVGKMLDSLSLAEIVRSVEMGTWEGLVEQASQGQAAFSPLRDAIRVSVGESAKHAANGIRGFTGSVDLYHPQAIAFLKDYTFNLIREATEEMKEGVRSAVYEGLTKGWNPRKTAKEIRSISTFGLTTRQRAAVANYRRLVEAGDREALTRALRDRRFDGSLKAQILGETNLTTAQIDKMVEAYERRYLRYRAETIARTESIRALSAGNRVAWKQFLEQKGKGENDLVRRWFVSPGERACPICRPIPRMNKDGRGFNEPFDTPDGPKMDAPIHPQCRCTVMIRLA